MSALPSPGLLLPSSSCPTGRRQTFKPFCRARSPVWGIPGCMFRPVQMWGSWATPTPTLHRLAGSLAAADDYGCDYGCCSCPTKARLFSEWVTGAPLCFWYRQLLHEMLRLLLRPRPRPSPSVPVARPPL